MKNPKHTPGPWTLGNENNECCEVILGTEHNLVCSLDRQDLNTSKVVISRDEMLANAHLIIAAPQLLNALKLFVTKSGCQLRSNQAVFPHLAEDMQRVHDSRPCPQCVAASVIKLAEGDL